MIGKFQRPYFFKHFLPLILAVCLLVIAVHSVTAKSTPSAPRPKVILISLDGAQPDRIQQYLDKGILTKNKGLGLLKSHGIYAKQNITCNPSLTAACHTSIGSGSNPNRTDVVANTFHLDASPFISTISGFNAPIGGYSLNNDVPAASDNPTAEPIWIELQKNGKKVVTATFPGGDGLNVTVPGLTNSPIIQPATQRTVNYTVPFGTTANVFEQGFTLNASDFTNAPDSVVNQLQLAGKRSYAQVKLANLETIPQVTGGGGPYNIQVAALDTTNDNKLNYDTLVFFDANQGIQPGPFKLPSTGPAYVSIGGGSQPFFFEGTTNKVGARFYITQLAADLSTVHVARSNLTYIPRNTPVLSSVDDINNNVGFWQPQPDYYFVERLADGIDNFSDQELESIYSDQVRNFVDYQARIALRAINQNPNADLVMVYIEEPDGSEHQFLLTDSRQATNPRDPNTIGKNQDQDKINRYQQYVEFAYKTADKAVQRIINAVGTDSNGKPLSNIIVVSDHGFTTFYTSVNLNAYLSSKGFDLNKVRAVTSGPAADIYINLEGREPNGTVTRQEYITLQQQIVQALKELQETNPNYNLGQTVNIFDQVYARPLPSDINDPTFGLGTNDIIAQDSGDVFATMKEGYNFDGTQSPSVTRSGDDSTTSQFLSVSNFYGAHGYNPITQEMSASFFAAGPDIRKGTLQQIRNIDIAPTIDRLLGVQPALTVQGTALDIN
jgi:predicted AlkP superfamily phosphohydrolase/phosphomutase